MPNYLLTLNNLQVGPISAADDAAAQALANNLGQGATFALTDLALPSQSDPAAIMDGRRKKGCEVVAMFGDDNFAAGIALSASQTKDLNAQFRDLREMLEGGYLGAALVYIRALPTDGVLTPERKAKYLSEIETYLASEGL